jgi:Flavinator of succinate dehydrogenase
MSISAKLARTLRTHRVSRILTPVHARLSSLPNAASSSRGSSQGNFTDPFPLPLSSKSFAEQEPIPEDILPPPIPRPNESLDALRSRLNYQSRKRGTLESDLLLSTFAKENLPLMSREQLEEFDKVITINLVGLKPRL